MRMPAYKFSTLTVSPQILFVERIRFLEFGGISHDVVTARTMNLVGSWNEK